MIEIENKRFLVVGLGKTGLATAKFLKRRGGVVTISDNAPADALGELLDTAREMDVAIETGGHQAETIVAADAILLSPGVPQTMPPLLEAAEKGIPVMGEMELAARFMTKPIVAVTGTNGKTTTTTLIGEILKDSGLHVFVGGNIGMPLISFADKGENADIAVVEVSSFQLDTISTFRPRVAVLLNIAEDHLYRYDDFDAYVRSKGRIFENQTRDDVAVINVSDFHVLKAAKGAKSRRLYYNGGRNITDGAVADGKHIDIVADGAVTAGVEVTSPALLATHNLENLSAAVLASLAVGGTIAGIQTAVDKFGGLAHRLQYVDTIDQVAYFDDSKATNPDAVRRALAFFLCPVILVMGGEDKGCDYGVLKNAIREHARAVVLIGEAKERIRSCINGAVPICEAETMAEAVRRARQLAESGDAVLLSPACSSFDMYESYARRGEDFCNAVKAIKEAMA
ncbi:MAG: UDP-N-acetylmuramoyl-L-alanine--D-glutamate ligase [Thermodesulfobacteriota bacterium]|nr:UDP-N-acetylmuramoyl-L-alanine--D-glutamate ligase [Thermodesulfobacteriota bacterium]